MTHIKFEQIRYPGEKMMTNMIHVLGAGAWILILGVFISIGMQISWLVAGGYLISFLGFFLVWPIAKLNAHIQGNGVLVSEQQFPEIYKIMQEFYELFKLPTSTIPEVYVVQSRGLNAFAVSAFSHNRVVLISDLVESLILKENWKELRAIVGHELGHHVARHPDFWLLDAPMHIFPFYVLALYQSRLAELTADRAGYFLAGNLTNTFNAYYKILAGPQLSQHFNQTAYLEQAEHNNHSFFLGVMNLFNTHPFFGERIKKLQAYDTAITRLNAS